MPQAKDLTGMRFGKLTVVRRMGSTSEKKALWECRCDCGKSYQTITSMLTQGKTKSCGCGRGIENKGNRQHGLSTSRLYNLWASMKYRCKRRRGKDYYQYVARGILVCDEWQKFENFRDWAFENGYEDNLTIDRIDNNKGYCPENCRWATMKQQCLNKRNTAYLTVDGVTLPRKTWAERSGIPYATLCWRLKKGWPPNKAVSTPIDDSKVSNKIKAKRLE